MITFLINPKSQTLTSQIQILDLSYNFLQNLNVYDPIFTHLQELYLHYNAFFSVPKNIGRVYLQISYDYLFN